MPRTTYRIEAVSVAKGSKVSVKDKTSDKKTISAKVSSKEDTEMRSTSLKHKTLSSAKKTITKSSTIAAPKVMAIDKTQIDSSVVKEVSSSSVRKPFDKLLVKRPMRFEEENTPSPKKFKSKFY
jgi:hypothetical protein